jgi:hypothetical protein
MSAMPDQPTPSNRKVVATMTVPLKCMLTPHEVGKKQAALLECHRKLRSHEQHEANVKAQLKRDRTAIESEMGAVVGVLESGYEMRDTAVEKIADYDAALVRHIRVDTGEEVDVERMSEAQKQTELDLRERAAADAARPTNPDEVSDVDPWGAPSDGRAPIAELPHDPNVIDADFIDGDGLVVMDSDDTDDSGDGAEGAPDGAPAEADRPSTDAGLTSDEIRIKHLVEWLPGQGIDVAREYLDGADVEDVRAIYSLVMDEAAGRAQKRTMIPKILDRLFNAPF